MLLKKIFFGCMFFTYSCASFAQMSLFPPTNFTWEGAITGNKAVWKADDTLNVYSNINGLDVKVSLYDPFKMNTTTSNQSEFNDYTKTNTFFQKGSFALQIKSTTSRQPVCMNFDFSKPVLLSKFYVYDVDMLQSSAHLLSTFQDSIHVHATNLSGSVPLTVTALSETPGFTINGSAVKANFIAGFNGDKAHTDPSGAVLVSSSQPIEHFELCYANGSEDDGTSNSHAIKIPGFEFTELLGSIKGTVYEDGTLIPLSGSDVWLADALTGEMITNKSGNVMLITTTTNGQYEFPDLPMGLYKIYQTNPVGYSSVRDIDDENDNTISVNLNVTNIHAINNDFFETQNSPLAADLTAVRLLGTGNDRYTLNWDVLQEPNNHYYSIEGSQDGRHFFSLGKVYSTEVSNGHYYFDFYTFTSENVFYIKLLQTDFDGNSSKIALLRHVVSDENFHIMAIPNPIMDQCIIKSSSLFEDNARFTITSIFGQILKSGTINNESREWILDVPELTKGVYFLSVANGNQSNTIKIIKGQ